jgi:hypothetical protein
MIKEIFKKIIPIFLLVFLTFIFSDNVFADSIVKCDGPDCNFTKFFESVTAILRSIYITSFSIATILFAYAGVLLMTSQGDTNKVDRARGIFKSVIIGLIIMAFSYWGVWFLLNQLGVGADFYQFLKN